MATRIRPIRLEIPEEHRLEDDEIVFLERALRDRLALVEPPGPAPVPDPPINTTRLPLEIEVVSRSGARTRRTIGRAPTKAASKKGAPANSTKKAAKKAAKKANSTKKANSAKKGGKGRK